MPPPDSITKDQFNELQTYYPFLIKGISASKGAKPGQKSLEELDRYRYNEALGLFSGDKPRKEMDLDAIKTLVEWKLRHGKFRPTLMSLVSSNEPQFAADTVRSAIIAYKKAGGKGDPEAASSALTILTKLKGIGPATASLLLSVCDPDHAIFFSDEAFIWLCGDGNPGTTIKYNANEYKMLCSAAQKLVKRLDVAALEVEKVAYVVVKDQAPTRESKPAPAAVKKEPLAEKKRKPAKETEPEETVELPLRRSKRSKA